MTIEIVQKPLDKISTDILLLFAFQDKNKKKNTFIPSGSFVTINKSLKGQLDKLCSIEQFTGELGSTVTIYTQNMIVPTKVVCMGLGGKDEFVIDDLRTVIGKYIGGMKKKIDSLAICLPDDVNEDVYLHAVIESVQLATYEFEKYKEKKRNERHFESLIIISHKKNSDKKNKEIIAKATLYAQATSIARDLVNETPSTATPTYLATLAKDIAKSSDQIKVKIFDKAELKKMGMHAFLGIARASETPPKFIFLEYTPKKIKGKAKLAVVGKGITFDSGGINVKPGGHMDDMKMDMAGAAVVLGIFSVIHDVKPSFPVMGVIAATPNLISGSSIVPGDVVRAYNGKTIEILNTDAEGRVTMADSLSYAVEKGATHIIDFATLTGACLHALGEDIAALFVNDRDFAETIKSSAFTTGEKMWELPLVKEYKQMNKSHIADIANIPNSRYAGTIAAALFLQEFIGNTKWAHLDIAGPAYASKPYDLGPKGGTGYGVRTVLQLLEGEIQK